MFNRKNSVNLQENSVRNRSHQEKRHEKFHKNITDRHAKYPVNKFHSNNYKDNKFENRKRTFKEFDSKSKTKLSSEKGKHIKFDDSDVEDDSDNLIEESEDNEDHIEDEDDNVKDNEDREEESEETKAEYEALRKELSEMPFEDLIKLRERLGTKMYNQVMNQGVTQEKTRKKQFKRENKNRPREMSSKKRVSVIRDVVPVKKKVNRDPRFDDLSGQYDEHFFTNAYSFIGDLKVREKEKIEKSLKKQKNPERKKEMNYLLSRMKQQDMAAKQKEKQKEIEKQWKKKEQERVKEGKTPFHLKKSDRRKLELAEKYKELKKSGKVDKYLTKKRKKTAQKEKKKLPVQLLDT